MNWLQSILYGFLSGFAEFLPVSASAHQLLFMEVFGMGAGPILDLCVHVAALLSLIIGCRTLLSSLRKEQANYRRAAQLRRRRGNTNTSYEMRLIKTATITMVIILFLRSVADKQIHTLYLILFLILNGIFLILPEHMRQANKGAQHMSGLDGILMGISGALSALPGISRNGSIVAFAVIRGADRQCAVEWALLLSIPALVVLAGMNVFEVFSVGVGVISFSILLNCILSAAAAFAGGLIGIRMIRFLAVRLDFSAFAYYSWGVALFTFVLYLIT